MEGILLNPTDTCSVEEAESGNKGVNSAITEGKVTQVFKQLLGGQAPQVD